MYVLISYCLLDFTWQFSPVAWQVSGTVSRLVLMMWCPRSPGNGLKATTIGCSMARQVHLSKSKVPKPYKLDITEATRLRAGRITIMLLILFRRRHARDGPLAAGFRWCHTPCAPGTRKVSFLLSFELLYLAAALFRTPMFPWLQCRDWAIDWSSQS